MTCIVGLIKDDKVYIGSDSAGVAGYDIVVRKDSKVFKIGDMLIGYTSSFRMGQLLRYNLEIPEHKQGVEIFEYMVREFIPAVRKCFKDGGFLEKDKEVERGGTFLVGYKGRLFSIENDYQVGEPTLPYDAVGCGSFYAKGSLFSTDDEENSPEDRVNFALCAAEYFNCGVRGPFNIMSI